MDILYFHLSFLFFSYFFVSVISFRFTHPVSVKSQRDAVRVRKYAMDMWGQACERLV